MNKIISFKFQVTTLEGFFAEEDLFFVYGSERASPDDFNLEFEGKCQTKNMCLTYYE